MSRSLKSGAAQGDAPVLIVYHGDGDGWQYPALVVGVWQRWKRRYYCELRRGRDCGENLASLVERFKSEVELIAGGGHPAAAAFSAEGDNFFKALDRLRYHLTGESPQMSKSYEG